MIHLTKIRHKTSKNDTKREKENTEMPKLTQNPRKKSKSCAYSGFFSYTYEPRLQLLMHPLNHSVGLRGRGAEGFVVGENEELPPFQYEPEVADRGVDSQQLPVKGL